MYRIENTTAAIKALQRLLGLNQTGNYDEATRSSVTDIQQRNALPINGVADYETFTRIVKEYRERIEEIFDSEYLFRARFPILSGYQGENAGRINEALNTVLTSYGYEEALPRVKYIGQDSMSGVKFLQGIFGMEIKEEIDERFMNRLLIELEGIEIKDGYR